MASRCIDSSGLSSLRLTVQHSGGRSFGWIDPSEYLPAAARYYPASSTGAEAASPRESRPAGGAG